MENQKPIKISNELKDSLVSKEEVNKRLQEAEAKRARALLETAMGSIQAFKLIKEQVIVKLINENSKK